MSLIVGVDEVGRGPLAGPLIAAAVVLDEQKLIPNLTDSKKISPVKRQQLGQVVRKTALDWAIGRVEVEEIDRFNVFYATLLAMRRALLKLSLEVDQIIVDGKYLPNILALSELPSSKHFDATKLYLRSSQPIWFKKDKKNKITLVQNEVSSKFEQAVVRAEIKPKSLRTTSEISSKVFSMSAVVKADATIPSVSAASIIAKVARDYEMDQLAKKYPQYGFEQHKGYPTALHLAQLKALGPISIHRTSFAPVKKILEL